MSVMMRFQCIFIGSSVVTETETSYDNFKIFRRFFNPSPPQREIKIYLVLLSFTILNSGVSVNLG